MNFLIEVLGMVLLVTVLIPLNFAIEVLRVLLFVVLVVPFIVVSSVLPESFINRYVGKKK